MMVAPKLYTVAGNNVVTIQLVGNFSLSAGSPNVIVFVETIFLLFWEATDDERCDKKKKVKQ